MKDSVEEAYMNMLVEMPQIIKTDTTEKVADQAKSLRDHIDLNHNTATVLDKENGYHHLKHQGGDLYYRHDRKESKELSYVSKNIQVGVEKRKDGDSNHIHNFMLHHLKHNGSIQSSNSNTDGSKKLWTNFIKKTPHLNHIAYNKRTLKTTKLTPNNIDHHADKVWGETPDKRDIRIISTNKGN
jgi:hypothetical protein